MKKIKIIAILLIVCSINIFAQNKLTVYVTGNYGLYKVKPSDIYSSAISSNFSGGFGVHLSYTIIPNLYIVALPVYQQRGYMSFNIYHNYDIRVSYIDIPIGVEYNFNAPSSKFLGLTDDDEKPLFVGIGLYEGFAISGNYTDKFTNNPAEKIKFGESLTDNRSSTDFGFNFNIGVRIRNFKIGIQKQLGLKNVVPTARQAAEGSIKTTGFGMFIAYKISKLKKKK
jgi:hypothetical protein